MKKETLCDSTDSIFLLPNSGFDVEAQVRSTLVDTETVQSTESFQNSIIQKCREDLVGFYWEYLKKEPVLPINIAISQDHQIICPRYENKRLLDTVSIVERGGAVYRNIEKLNRDLPLADDETAFIFTSPPGESGFDGITYPESQTFFFQKKGSSVNAMTVVNSMTLTQSLNLIKRITGEDVKPTLNDITGTLIRASNFSIHDLINQIEEVTETSLPSTHTAADKNPVVDLVIDNILTNFELFIRENIFSVDEESKRLLKLELGRTVLSMQNVVKRGTLPTTQEDYLISLSEVQEIGGCNGGGYIETGLGLREAEYDFTIWGICRYGKCKNSWDAKWLGPCHICKECDTILRSQENTREEISSSIQEPLNVKMHSLFPLAIFAFIGALLKSR